MEEIAHEQGGNFHITWVPWDQSQRIITSTNFDVLIVDVSIGASRLANCIALARSWIKAGHAVIVMADSFRRFVAEELVRAGAYAYCSKTPSMPDLVSLLRNVHEDAHPERMTPVHLPGKEGGAFVFRGQCDALIGSSPAMNEIYKIIERVKDLDASVLITGESGTGKELAARAIHNLGERSSQPFTAVSCSAIPESLIESELFGHERGAFTGSTGQHHGYFEQVGDGSLFLDEIGDISLYSQVKLLRVIQQREFNRLGGNRSIRLRARFIFATHRDLAQMVQDGSFRQDLFYRINVIHIHLPALRDHAEDIPEIAQNLLRKYSSAYNKSISTFSPEAMQMLLQYNWPGNVRELENVVQNAMILANTSVITEHDIRILSDSPLYAHVTKPDENDTWDSFENSLRTYKFKIASDAVRAHNGNKTLAARSLNVSRSYLHRLLHLGNVDYNINSVF